MIMMWSGTIATIPSGWALCNGSGGTPDLRDRFIVGASVDSGGQSVTTITGGNTKTGGTKDAVVVSHNHTATTTATDSGHIHGVPESTQLLNSGNGFATGVTATPRNVNSRTGFANISASTTVDSAGVSGTNANLVPYFALAFIMKL
jgi:microcystin-dependent protein